ncbi:MAG: HAMP domain-containing sensor histidine kinase [Gemmataceae bacterium]
MARAWRLRHKLVLGLALVVGSVALLLGGALFGLSSYMDATQSTRRTLDEIIVAIQLRDHLHLCLTGDPTRTPDPRQSTIDRERDQVQEFAGKARETLGVFRDMYQENQPYRAGGRVTPEQVQARVDGLTAGLGRLERAVADAAGPGAPPAGGSDRPITGHPKVMAAHVELIRYSGELVNLLAGDAKEAFDRSYANHRRSNWVAGSAAAVAVVLVLTLLYYFRVWVFAPIQQLQAGVRRVKGGDFDHPIQLASQDELEELAAEFNAMTARLRDIYKDLARQVEEQSRRLVDAEKMVSVGYLAAGVAHEINNPMASIAFSAEALERRLQPLLALVPDDAEVIRKYLGMIENEAFRCKEITDRLLNYSREGPGRREVTDLAGPVQNVFDLLRHNPVAQGKRLTLAADGPVLATIDPHEIQGVVNNLVVNALEHTDPGGAVTVALRQAGDAAEVAVADTGCGMTPEVARRVFEPFFTRSRTGKGNGLGLFIAHQAVTKHGGTVTASSPGPGRGSTFVVRLPAAAGQDARGPREPATLPFPGVRAAA